LGGETRSGTWGKPRPGEEVVSVQLLSQEEHHQRRGRSRIGKAREGRVYDKSLSERSNLNGEFKEGEQENGNGLSYVLEVMSSTE